MTRSAALKLAMQMGDKENVDENEESVEGDANDSDLYVSLLSHSQTLPPSCAILSTTDVQIVRQALPETQAGIRFHLLGARR